MLINTVTLRVCLDFPIHYAIGLIGFNSCQWEKRCTIRVDWKFINLYKFNHWWDIFGIDDNELITFRVKLDDGREGKCENIHCFTHLYMYMYILRAHLHETKIYRFDVIIQRNLPSLVRFYCLFLSLGSFRYRYIRSKEPFSFQWSHTA